MSIPAGTRLGTYEIICHIGSGGMGEVYQARDSKLGRDVAIKILPERFADNVERLARFQREARLLAALNHPNIAAIYGLDQSGEIHFLIMELVPGETLAHRIRRGPLSVAEALPIARQIAGALAAAHGGEKCIIHRDLKPGNVKVMPDGRVKVLDFGLAKDVESGSGPADEANAPTLSILPTMPGAIMGTPAYMSPEQARGGMVDKRTDVWAFGCVFYEMLTGKRAFAGQTTQDQLAGVLAREIDLQPLPSTIPGRIRDLLRGCLQKDAEQRPRDFDAVRKAIDEIAGPHAVSHRRYFLAAAACLAVLLGLGGWFYRRMESGPPTRPLQRSPALRLRRSHWRRFWFFGRRSDFCRVIRNWSGLIEIWCAQFPYIRRLAAPRLRFRIIPLRETVHGFRWALLRWSRCEFPKGIFAGRFHGRARKN
jgi:serine/threonine protein kinase